jgi:hypothetical protein
MEKKETVTQKKVAVKKVKKAKVNKEIPTRVQLVQDGITFKTEGNNIYFDVKKLKTKYNFLTNFEFDEKEFEDGFIGVKLQDLQIKE